MIDEAGSDIVATPFPKFFNVGEKHAEQPCLPFETFEKLDGSLIITFHHAGQWRTATKGAFDSEQAVWGRERLNALDTSALRPGTTYLFEAIYPENRIVVRYTDPALVLLAAFDAVGLELAYADILDVAGRLGCRAAKRYPASSIADLVQHAATLPRDDEGFVLRYSDGTRVKLKGAEYRRIHALISRCTPIAMWEAMNAGDDMAAIRRDLPEEFWPDFDDIVRLLNEEIIELERRVAELAASVSQLDAKQLGLRLPTLPADTRNYLFSYRKWGGIQGQSREALMRSIRPTANVLPGYTPSYAMSRMMEDAMS